MKFIKKIIWPLKISFLTGRAISREQKGKPLEAIDCHVKAFKYCKDDLEKAKIVEAISNIYWRLGNLEEALKYAQGAQAVYERKAHENEYYKTQNEKLLGNIAAIKTANKQINRTE